MKLYAHWDGDQPFTKVIKLDDGYTVTELRGACWEALKARHPQLAANGPATLRLTGPDRRPLALSSCLADVISSGDDVFYQVSAGLPPSSGQPAPATAVQPSSGASAAPGSGLGEAAGGTAALKARDIPLAAQQLFQPAGAAASPAAPLQASSQANDAAASGGNGVASEDPAAPASAGGAKAADGAAGRAAASASATSTASSNSGAAADEALAPVVRALWLRAEEAAAQLHYRGAGDILQQALLLVPEPSSPTHIATLMRLARLWLSAGNPGAAVQWALRAAKQRPYDPRVLELAGDCLREGGRPREAAAQYQSALEALQEEGELGPEEEERGKQASAPTASFDVGASPDASSPPLLRLRLALAACLTAIPGSITPPYDNQDLAASLVMAVLESDPGHWEALRLYARIALDRGLMEDALRVALRLVVGRPKHAGAKALLAECLKDEDGCRQLYEELGLPPPDAQPAASAAVAGDGGASSSNSGTAAALAFVATAVKDFGKVDTAISLLARAARLEPCHPSYRLNLVHALELRQELQAALQAGRGYCRDSGAQLAGRPLRDVDTLLCGLPELGDPLGLAWYGSEPLWGCQQPHVPSQASKEQGRSEGGKAAAGGGSGGAGGAGAAIAPVSASSVKVSYSSDQLDELALLFTLAKVLFVGGALTAAARLCELVEPLRSASAVELHTTLIRNEAAYFGCVAQLLKDYPPPPARPPPQQQPKEPAATGNTAGGAAVPASRTDNPAPLYLVGDSHCLSEIPQWLAAAWRLVTLRGEQRLLRPLLVTGCKVWHLRPASEFYPKKQFEATLRLLPDGVQVVLVLGEIDCREGLLLAVQKGKYNSVAEGIDATVAIYLGVLRGMILERGMEVFVHPVPPVLNETRSVVAPFTAALRAAVATARAADPSLRRRLHYLDFFDQLLVPREEQQLQQGGGNAAGTAVAVNGGGAAAPAGSGGTGASGALAVAIKAPPEVAMPSSSREAVVVAKGDRGGTAGRDCAGALGGGTTQADSAAPTTAPAAAAVGWALRSDLAFDGTHLAPTYVPLLDAALSTVG